MKESMEWEKRFEERFEREEYEHGLMDMKSKILSLLRTYKENK